MKVVLLRDVPKIGKKYEVKEVSDGYVRNFLLPKKLAEIATPTKIATLNALKEKNQEARRRSEQLLKEAIQALSESTFTIRTKADDQGHLFKKVRAEDIVNTLNEKSSVPLDVSMVEIESPFVTLGSHKVTLRAAGVEVQVTVVIQK